MMSPPSQMFTGDNEIFSLYPMSFGVLDVNQNINVGIGDGAPGLFSNQPEVEHASVRLDLNRVCFATVPVSDEKVSTSGAA